MNGKNVTEDDDSKDDESKDDDLDLENTTEDMNGKNVTEDDDSEDDDSKDDESKDDDSKDDDSKDDDSKDDDSEDDDWEDSVKTCDDLAPIIKKAQEEHPEATEDDLEEYVMQQGDLTLEDANMLAECIESILGEDGDDEDDKEVEENKCCPRGYNYI